MKTIFFGASSYVIPVVEVLKKNFELELVITTEKQKNDPLISFCISKKIPYLCVTSKEELERQLQKQKLDTNSLGVVADFGIIIPQAVLDLFTHGVLNIHPSLLPKYRGSTPVQSAILNGESKTAVTIIKLDAHMDHGPIVFQEEEIIGPEDSSESLYHILFVKSAQILENLIPKFVKSELELREQDHSQATFTKTLNKNDGFIDIASFPDHKKLENMIRAFYPWPSVWTKTNVNESGAEKIIKFLPHKRIQVEGKKEMIYKDFLNGYPSANNHLKLFLEQNV